MNAIRRLVSAYELKPASPSTLPHRTASFDPPSEGLLLCGACCGQLLCGACCLLRLRLLRLLMFLTIKK
eukprot:SAG22_NODE_7196_length_763_cov_2.588855_1_plen_69_part_00